MPFGDVIARVAATPIEDGVTSSLELLEKTHKSMQTTVENSEKSIITKHPELAGIADLQYNGYKASISDAMQKLSAEIGNLGLEERTIVHEDGSSTVELIDKPVSQSQLKNKIAERKQVLTAKIEQSHQILETDLKKALEASLRRRADEKKINTIIANFKTQLQADKKALLQQYDSLSKVLQDRHKESRSADFTKNLNNLGYLRIKPSPSMHSSTLISDANYTFTKPLEEYRKLESADGKAHMYTDDKGNFIIKHRPVWLGGWLAGSSPLPAEVEAILIRATKYGKTSSMIHFPQKEIWKSHNQRGIKFLSISALKIYDKCALQSELIGHKLLVYDHSLHKGVPYRDWLRSQTGGEMRLAWFDAKVKRLKAKYSIEPDDTMSMHGHLADLRKAANKFVEKAKLETSGPETLEVTTTPPTTPTTPTAPPAPGSSSTT